jgi:adenylate kinase family enzyme
MAIYIFGASCSGKSTLSKALQKSLGNEWIRIDRDDLIEQEAYSDADAVLEEKIQLIKDKIIIDAQIPWRKKRVGEFYFFVLPPLQTLLERDAVRTMRLKRSEERAARAKVYVINTHQTLDAMEQTDFDQRFDSSQVSVEEEVAAIKSALIGQQKII